MPSDVVTGSLLNDPAAPPARVRRSKLRTLATLLLLIVLTSLIAGYAVVTNPDRVRSVSQRYLTEICGGTVTIGRAKLSLFEGLRLDDIKVYTDDSRRDESLVFEARSLHAGYNPRALLTGRIEATRVLALEPRVHLVEDVDRGEWNFQRLTRPGSASPDRPVDASATPMRLPEVVLRSARVNYAQIERGTRTQIGTLTLEGQLVPGTEGAYRFRLQSRGDANGAFPVAEGWVSSGGQQWGVVLSNVDFVDEIKTTLPAVVRRFWEEHRLAGRISETRISYFRKPTGRPGFRVETDLASVRLSILPEKWLGPAEQARILRWDQTAASLASPALGSSIGATWMKGSMSPKPIELEEVSGKFVFTDDAIRVSTLTARVGGNQVKISGYTRGYHPRAPGRFRIESFAGRPLSLSDRPAHLASMPWAMQEIYYRFLPRGSVEFGFDVERAEDGRFTADGELRLSDGSLQYATLPYPLRNASGTFRISQDPDIHRPRLDIVQVKGNGIAGGPNADTEVVADGVLVPLDETAAARMRVTAKNVQFEPALLAALPTATQAALRRLHSPQTNEPLVFTADVQCDLSSPPGADAPWTEITHISARQISGRLDEAQFSFAGASTSLTLHEQLLELHQLTVPLGGGNVVVSGDVRLDPALVSGKKTYAVRPDLTINVAKVKVDEALLARMNAQRFPRLNDYAVNGEFNGTGRFIVPLGQTKPRFDADVQLSGGTAYIKSKNLALTDVAIDARIDNQSVTVKKVSAMRGSAALQGQAKIDLTQAEPVITAEATVQKLSVDAALLASLPPSIGQAVSSLQPAGTIDASVNYKGTLAAADYRLVVKPRELSLTPTLLPIPFEKLSGELVLDKGFLHLNNVTAQSDTATLRVTGSVEPRSGETNVTVAARNIHLNDALRSKLPPSLRQLLESLNLRGSVSVDLSRLVIRPRAGAEADDLEFEGRLWLDDVSFDAAAPVTAAKGVITLKGVIDDRALRELAGAVSLDSLQLAGRPVRKLTARIHKPANQDLLQVDDIDGRIADGTIAGQVDSIASGKDPRFGLSLVLRNAKVSELTGDTDMSIDGRLTASLSLEGRWDDPRSRRGRGDVLVEGREMYRVPVLFGLMQMANLSLPGDAPFRQAGLQYSVQGNRVNLEAIDLRSTNTSMSGNGWIDFESKQVQMTLLMSNSAADAMPLFGDLIRGARQDLMQIRVRGSLQEPKVGASTFNTLTTTVDEVLRGKQ